MVRPTVMNMVSTEEETFSSRLLILQIHENRGKLRGKGIDKIFNDQQCLQMCNLEIENQRETFRAFDLLFYSHSMLAIIGKKAGRFYSFGRKTNVAKLFDCIVSQQ